MRPCPVTLGGGQGPDSSSASMGVNARPRRPPSTPARHSVLPRAVVSPCRGRQLLSTRLFERGLPKCRLRSVFGALVRQAWPSSEAPQFGVVNASSTGYFPARDGDARMEPHFKWRKTVVTIGYPMFKDTGESLEFSNLIHFLILFFSL